MCLPSWQNGSLRSILRFACPYLHDPWQLLLIVFLFVPAIVLGAPKPGPAQQFGRELYGTITVSITGAGTWMEEGDDKPSSERIEYTARHKVKISAKEAFPGNKDNVKVYRGKEEAFSASVYEESSYGGETTSVIKGEISDRCPGGRDISLLELICEEGIVSMVVVPAEKTYEFVFNGLVVPANDGSGSSPDVYHIRVPGFRIESIPLPKNPDERLTGSKTFYPWNRLNHTLLRNEKKARNIFEPEEMADYPEQQDTRVPLKAVISWDFGPPQILTVAVDADSYDSWLPEGSLDSSESPGNYLLVRAKVRDETDPRKPRKARIQFSLAHVSENKGVCMNWPSDQSTFTNRGLRFRESDYPAGGPIVFEGEGNLRTRDLVEEVEVLVHAHDYGAWGTLRVTAQDTDGNEIKVKVRGKETPDLDIPKDEDANRVADAWDFKYRSHGSAADTDEDNDPPGKGFTYRGDGLTLYEEYRGFRVNGGHVRTDPTRKDLFIRDDTTGSAQAGLDIFEKATKLKIWRVDKQELGESRIINANSDSKTHQVDQHGLIIKSTDLANAQQIPVVENDKFGPPGMTLRIDLPKNGNYDSGEGADDVAHELAHAIGVQHHGEEGTLPRLWKWETLPGGTWQLYEERIGVDDFAKPVFLPNPVKKPIQVFFEDNGRELHHGEKLPPDYVPHNDGWIVMVGAKDSEYSGDQECLMRYPDKQAFISEKDPENVRFIPDDTQEKRRTRLCTDRFGTGVNDVDHNPQSRYGHAVNGNCAGQVVINDKFSLK